MDCRKWSDRYSTDCDLKYNSEATRYNYKSKIQFMYENQTQPESGTEIIAPALSEAEVTSKLKVI